MRAIAYFENCSKKGKAKKRALESTNFLSKVQSNKNHLKKVHRKISIFNLFFSSSISFVFKHTINVYSSKSLNTIHKAIDATISIVAK